MSEVFDRFFPHVTDDQDTAKFLTWLSTQKTEEIEEFIAYQNLKPFEHQIRLMKLELNRRKEKSATRQDRLRFWAGHFLSFVTGAMLVFLTQL